MNDMVTIAVTREVYERLQLLMVPPISDASAVIDRLLYHDGHASPAKIALEAEEHHYTLAQELERAQQGIYECGGCT